VCANSFYYSWRRIKQDYLTHNHKPRVDYLIWIIAKRLMPTYERLIDQRFTYTGRHRRPAAWRKPFKREWRRCEVTPITDPDDDTYNPLPYRWVCSCPAFVKSRFLVCKHLVQLVHRVPPKFFQQVVRERSFPIWRHADLRPLAPPKGDDLPELVKSSAGVEAEGPEKQVNDLEECDKDEDEENVSNSASEGESDGGSEVEEGAEAEIGGKTKEMEEIAAQLRDLADAIQYNAQYADPRALAIIAQKTKVSVHLIKKIRQKEKLVHSTTTPSPPVFARAHADLMFIRTRPRNHKRT